VLLLLLRLPLPLVCCGAQPPLKPLLPLLLPALWLLLPLPLPLPLLWPSDSRLRLAGATEGATVEEVCAGCTRYWY
jgi:hypothetical protein